MNDEFNINIGCVIYTETNSGIKAEWISKKKEIVEKGHGIGIRLTELNEERRFEGAFEITYVDADGNKSPKLHLVISFEVGHYNLTWKYNGKTTDVGIGIESDHKLVGSYTAAIYENSK